MFRFSPAGWHSDRVFVQDTPFRQFEPFYRRWTQLPQSSLALSLALDLSLAKAELLLENALLRQQLIIVQRQVTKPRLTRTDRLPLKTTFSL